ncbi:MAG: hypothetical protein F6K30_04885 [Cyanothece sp. SIO2G6]|nr:hypothetical protein [Cyanothece sp. SIO2G6]
MDHQSSPSSSRPSLWDSKPWWCQPWSIVLTGLTVPTVAWVLSHRLWIVVPLGGLVLGWWILFLYIVPKSYANTLR